MWKRHLCLGVNWSELTTWANWKGLEIATDSQRNSGFQFSQEKRLGTCFLLPKFWLVTQGLPNASHLFNAAFYQPRDRTPTRLTIGSIWELRNRALSFRTAWLSRCLRPKQRPWTQDVHQKRFFLLDLVFFFSVEKMGFIGNKLTKAKHVFCLTSQWFTLRSK